MSGWPFQIGRFCRGGNQRPKSDWPDNLSRSPASLSIYGPIFLRRLSDHGILLTSLTFWAAGISSLSPPHIHILPAEAQGGHPASLQPLPAPQHQSYSIRACITWWSVAPGCHHRGATEILAPALSFCGGRRGHRMSRLTSLNVFHVCSVGTSLEIKGCTFFFRYNLHTYNCKDCILFIFVAPPWNTVPGSQLSG